MNTRQSRRTFLQTAGAAGVLSAVGKASPAAQGYVVGPNQGEHLIHFRDHGNIFIKISPDTGSNNLAIGTQQVTKGAGIPVHRHFHMDEVFYVLEGGGTFALNDVPHSFEKGGVIFIPKNSWHAFENPDHELLLLWIVSPPGLEGFFRETCSPPGVPSKQFTREEIREIARKYGTEFR